MASLANLPKLRRTLTDVMEDELYHIPGQNRSTTTSPTLQHALLANSQRFNNSQEFLSIPDSFTEAHNNIMTNPTLIEDEGDEDMLIDDIEEQEAFDNLYTPETFNIQPFNPFHDYANPNVFNSYNNHLHQSTILQQDPFQSSFELPLTVSPRDAHIKLPEEVMTADSNSALFNSNYDQLFVWPNESANTKDQIIGPEQLYLDEISGDEEEDMDDDDDDLMDTDLNYYDVNDDYSPPSSPTNSRVAHDKMSNIKSSPLSFNTDEIKPLQPKNQDLFVKKEEPQQQEVPTDDIKEETPNDSSRSRRKQSAAVGTISADGLHQCQLINPSTHKPCLKQFSRPYDLVRHQETIHASKKKIYRCTLCEDDFNKSGNARLLNKTFSRGDALSRHIRVKHGLTGTEANELIRIAKENVEYIDVQC